MKPIARLAAFAALLAVVFAAAAFAGHAVDPDADTSAEEPHAMPTSTTTTKTDDHATPHGGGDAHGAGAGDGAAPGVKGLAVSQDGYTLELADRERPARRDTRLRFRIVDADGEPVTRFAVEHERRMHLIVVRRDQTGFQHLHPRMSRNGTWTTAIRFDEPGSYRVFADFKVKGGDALTLGSDLAVDGRAAYRPLPESAPLADAGDGYEVRLDNDPVRAGKPAVLRFTVHRNGRAVHTEPYLGAGGHLVALRDGDLAYLHTHPVEDDHDDEAAANGAHDDSIPFETTFPSAGRYRLFLQFKHGGRIRTAAFTAEVSR